MTLQKLLVQGIQIILIHGSRRWGRGGMGQNKWETGIFQRKLEIIGINWNFPREICGFAKANCFAEVLPKTFLVQIPSAFLIRSFLKIGDPKPAACHRQGREAKQGSHFTDSIEALFVFGAQVCLSDNAFIYESVHEFSDACFCYYLFSLYCPHKFVVVVTCLMRDLCSSATGSEVAKVW